MYGSAESLSLINGDRSMQGAFIISILDRDLLYLQWRPFFTNNLVFACIYFLYHDHDMWKIKSYNNNTLIGEENFVTLASKFVLKG